MLQYKFSYHQCRIRRTIFKLFIPITLAILSIISIQRLNHGAELNLQEKKLLHSERKKLLVNDEKCSTSDERRQRAPFEIHKNSITFNRLPFTAAVSIKLKFV